MTKTRKWIQVTDGIIVDVHSSNVEQENMIEVPWNSDLKAREPITWYDENFMRKSDSQLVKEGTRTDNRGYYWNTKNCKEKMIIKELDIEIPEGYTAIEPVTNEPCIWVNNHWEINENEREITKILERLEIIDKQAGASRKIRSVTVDMGQVLEVLREAMPELLERFDPRQNIELQDIIKYEEEAIGLREKMNGLNNT